MLDWLQVVRFVWIDRIHSQIPTLDNQLLSNSITAVPSNIFGLMTKIVCIRIVTGISTPSRNKVIMWVANSVDLPHELEAILTANAMLLWASSLPLECKAMILVVVRPTLQ